MPKSVFLDKIVTSMHRPRRDGSTGFVSTTCFPDLSHTQITTNYCPQPTTACTPLGNMTLKFRIEAHRETRSAQRPVSEFMRRPKFFRRAHNVFANKVLLDLENSKRIKNTRRQQIWETGKADYGFEGLEDSFITQTDGDAGLACASMFQEAGFNNVSSALYQESIGEDTGVVKAGQNKLLGFHEMGQATTQNAGGDEEYGEEEFDNFQYADDFNPEMVETIYPEDFGVDAEQLGDSGEPVSLPVDDNVSMMRPGTSTAQRAGTASGGNRTASSSASVRFSNPIPPPGMGVDTALGARPGTSAGTVSRSQTQQESDVIQDYEILAGRDSISANTQSRPTTSSMTAASSDLKNKKKKKKHLPPARKRRAYNRSTFFELLLDTMEVPNPHAPRFGMLRTSPSRVGNRKRGSDSRLTREGPSTDPGAGYTKPNTAADISRGLSSLTVGGSATLTQTKTWTAPATTNSVTGQSSNQEDEGEDEPIAGDPFDKWDMGSVERAMTGEKYYKPKDYR